MAPSAPVSSASVPVAPQVKPERQPWQAQDAPRRAYGARVERWRPLVREMLAEAWMEGRLDGHATRLDDDLILSLIQQESGGNPSAVSWAGALGLMQVMPFTFADMHHGSKALGDHLELGTMLDVPSNMRAGIRYLALAMQAHEGNFYWAIASYNAGIEAVDDWRAVGLYAVPPVGGYDETAHYAQVVMHTYLAHRPDVQFRVPDAMPYEHVPGAVRLLKDAGRW